MSIPPPLSMADVVNGAIGPFDRHCMGYLNPGASGHGYVNAMKLSVNKVDCSDLDPGMEEIFSYDRCEMDDAYFGEINFLTATSFTGINGVIWGVDLARASALAHGAAEPIDRFNGIPLYPIGPVLDAGERLFGRLDREPGGRRDRRRFPPLPGAHIICANKDVGVRGPAYAWSAIAVGVARDRGRCATLFMEDVNTIPAHETVRPGGRVEVTPTRAQAEAILDARIRHIGRTMSLWGEDRGMPLTEIYAGARYIYAGPHEWGVSLTCIPYLLLPRGAIPAGSEPAGLLSMTLEEWEGRLGLEPLPPAPRHPDSGGVGC
ncbi:MAG TPA: histidine decarboxylase, pyruvoyl type [Longimicrobium sp.]|jgi:histidine decarboxylase|uniref:histidine decarboxylase, pyruvoyl type n=1 Tax=Longimicrobium sp. TaxID=2029185 RepID=UPI002ED98066